MKLTTASFSCPVLQFSWVYGAVSWVFLTSSWAIVENAPDFTVHVIPIVTPEVCKITPETHELTNCVAPNFQWMDEKLYPSTLPFESALKVERTLECGTLPNLQLTIEIEGQDSTQSRPEAVNFGGDRRKILQLQNGTPVQAVRIYSNSPKRLLKQIYPHDCRIQILFEGNRLAIRSTSQLRHYQQFSDQDPNRLRQALGQLIKTLERVLEIQETTQEAFTELSYDYQPLEELDFEALKRSIEVIQNEELGLLVRFIQSKIAEKSCEDLRPKDQTFLKTLERNKILVLIEELKAQLPTLPHGQHPEIRAQAYEQLHSSESLKEHFEKLFFETLDDLINGPTGVVQQLIHK